MPTGAQLADWWLAELHRDHQPGAMPDQLQAWVEHEFRNVPGFSYAKRADFYGHIY